MKFEYTFNGFVLKALLESDYEMVYDFYNRNQDSFDLYEYQKPDNFYTEEFIQTMLKAEHQGFLTGTFVRLFLFNENNQNQIIGCVSFSNIHLGTTNSCQIGYKIDKHFQNQGLGTIMVMKALEIITKEKGMHRIEAYIHPDNKPSLKLVRNLGFLDEGVAHSYIKINDSWQDVLRFAYISR